MVVVCAAMYAAMSLQLFVRRTGNGVIIQLHGRATMDPAHDILHSWLRRLIADGTKKVLVGLTDVAA